MTSEYRELSGRIKQEAPEYATGAELMGQFASDLEKQGLLPKSLLSEVVAEFRAGKLNTPDAITKGWQTRWSVWGEKADLEIVVPEFPDSQQDLEKALERGDKPIYVPAELSTQVQRPLLIKIWPQMQSSSVREGNSVTNEVDHSGWRYVERIVDAPNLNTTEKQLRDKFEKAGREGMSITEFIIASQDAKLLEGTYFDQGSTWASLLGSRNAGHVVGARFAPSGDLRVFWGLGAGNRGPDVGGRSALGVTKA